MSKEILLFVLAIGPTFVPLRPVHAQFDSGSSGADGAFSPVVDTVLTCPEPNCVFNFTTVNIPSGVTVGFNPSSFNSPVTVLAQGDVVIDGTISVSGFPGLFWRAGGSGGAGGPGGFRGGNAGGSYPASTLPGSGLGPGGGLACDPSSCPGGIGAGSFATTGQLHSGPLYGTPSLLPLIGGSGGSGGSGCVSSACEPPHGGGGGGGGGAILIASSTSIIFSSTGTVSAGGGPGAPGDHFLGVFGGGGGSGGAIRLIANAITGNGVLAAPGGLGSGEAGGGLGRIRLESGAPIPDSLLQRANPGPSVQIFPPAVPPLVIQPNLPTILLTSVDDLAVPNPPGGQFGRTDVTLTATGTKSVGIAASGIPLGTTIQVIVKPETDAMPAATVTSTPLVGTVNSSTATANINLPTFAAYFLEARATFTVPSGALGLKIQGEKVKQMRVETAKGAGSQLSYILESGKEVPGERKVLASSAPTRK